MALVTTSLGFMSLRGEKSFAVCNQDCGVGPRSFLIAQPFAWSLDAKRLFVNLVYFGKSTPRTVVLSYRSDASPETLWPKGLFAHPIGTRARNIALRGASLSGLSPQCRRRTLPRAGMWLRFSSSSHGRVYAVESSNVIS